MNCRPDVKDEEKNLLENDIEKCPHELSTGEQKLVTSI
jgi:hypothetical protein